jgi:hypothetical protein
VKKWRTSSISSGCHRKQEEGKAQVVAMDVNGEDVEEGENEEKITLAARLGREGWVRCSLVICQGRLGSCF